MTFTVPKGESLIYHLSLEPTGPEGGLAQTWPLVVKSGPTPGPVSSIDVEFSGESTPEERLRERLVLVISIADECQTDEYSWRFCEGGLVYQTGEGDYLDEVGTYVSQDNGVLTLSIKSLTPSEETIKFSFMALRRDIQSGKCKIFASKDPSGQIRRP